MKIPNYDFFSCQTFILNKALSESKSLCNILVANFPGVFTSI